MRDKFSIAIFRNARSWRGEGVRAEFSDWTMPVRHFFHPCVLAFLALAVTVGGWGYGYKLSQYLQHSDVTKASHTRMWVDHRDDSFGAPVYQQHSVDKFQSAQFARTCLPRLPHLSRELVFAAPIQSRVLTFVSPLYPLRAPPAFHSSLA